MLLKYSKFSIGSWVSREPFYCCLSDFSQLKLLSEAQLSSRHHSAPNHQFSTSLPNYNKTLCLCRHHPESTASVSQGLLTLTASPPSYPVQTQVRKFSGTIKQKQNKMTKIPQVFTLEVEVVKCPGDNSIIYLDK